MAVPREAEEEEEEGEWSSGCSRSASVGSRLMWGEVRERSTDTS